MAEPGANTVYPNYHCSIAFNSSLTDILLHSVKLTVAAAQKQSIGLLCVQYGGFGFSNACCGIEPSLTREL